MNQAEGQRMYDAGYQAGRAACVSSGSSSAARLLLEARRRDRDHAYDAGYEWALWDYDDANGLRTEPIRRRTRNAG